MTAPVEFEPGWEPERYELDALPAAPFRLDRRGFLQAAVAGILVVLILDREAPAQESGGRRRMGGRPVPQEIGAWLHVDEEGWVNVFTGKVEVGQNIRTSLTQVVAEELRAPVASIRLVMADTRLTPFDAGTFGSRTTPDMAARLRRVAAATREALVDLAAEQWKVERTALTVAEGKVSHPPTRQSAGFGKLTLGQKLTRTVMGEPPTTPPHEWKVAGQPLPKVDGRDLVTGKHRYTPDVTASGMVHGKILRAPSPSFTLFSVDLHAAEAMPGVTVVRDGDFIGVVAPTQHQATRAVAAIQAEWKPAPMVSSQELFTSLREQGRAARKASPAAPRDENTIERREGGEVRLERTFNVAYIAHAPLEPRAAVAQWEGDELIVWTGTQRPFGVRGELAEALKVPEEKVRVIVPDTGSGYGGKHTGEAAVEAARLARAAGKPVKLVWSREEEFTWAYFRPAGVIEMVAAARADGTLTAWEHHNYNSGASAIRTLYEVPNPVAQFYPVRAPLRQGSYRGLAATANHFARETLMDELAHAVGMDPLEFRLKNLKDARLRAVLEAAAKTFGWGKKPAPGRGFGIAGGSEKGSYVATCAEVDCTGGRPRVVRAVTAFECGAVLNPEHLKNQVEGAVVQGLGGALTEAIEFEGGKLLNARFSTYAVPRFRDAPQQEVVLLDRKDLPSVGAGETPIVAIAPAVGNAIFAATGARHRSLPMRKAG